MLPTHRFLAAAFLPLMALSACSTFEESFSSAATEEALDSADSLVVSEVEVQPIESGLVTKDTSAPNPANVPIEQPLITVKPKPAPDDLLEELATKFSWDTHAENSQVKQEISRHQRNPKHFHDILERSEPFLALISQKIEARDLPAELAFLPFVESGYDASIFSHRSAAGLWQFIPSTARYLDMEMDWWYDERLDIEISTNKALDYLTYLNNRFDGNWELALAAYNGGEGHVASRIKLAGGKSDFWSIELKQETTSYVPKLLAAVEILSDPGHYGVTVPNIPLGNQLTSVQLDSQIDLRQAAKKIDLSYQDLQKLNAGFLRWISPPTQSVSLLVPAAKKSALLAALDNITTDDQMAWNHYRVERGDTLIEIAREFGTTLRALISINQLEGSRIYPNQNLLIPKSELSLTRTASQANSVKQLYIVKNGDSLWEISRDQGVPIDQIRRLNDLKGNTIRTGKVLVLAETFTGKEITYEVRRGDSLSVIASRFQVAVADIRVWNSLDNDLIRPGQELTIRPNNS